MSQRLLGNPFLRNKIAVFEDRADAGRQLASLLGPLLEGEEIILAIPAGGVPIASEIAKALSLPMDLLMVRKIQIPWNTEAGFGAVDPDGGETFNHELLEQLGLTESEIREQVEKTLTVIHKRNTIFRHDRPFPELRDKGVILVDDGLASGYTMLAAVRFVRKRKPRKIMVAVPTAHDRTIGFILPEVEEMVCLNVREGSVFAVAESYRNWYDLADAEVLSIIEKIK